MGILKKHADANPVVVDPFCGRGTTIYAARKAQLQSYGFDISPIAVAIAKAKLASSSLDRILELAEELLTKEPFDIPEAPFFHHAFAPETLKELCSLREGLLQLDVESNESALLRAAALGCLHGPMAKNREFSGYFSNQMPRTFSSKPDYSIRYWKEKNLAPPEVSVLNVIKRKLSRIPDLSEPTVGTFKRIKCADARLAAQYRNISGTILVITSPPYYGMTTYIQDQWLRNWFLGGPASVEYQGHCQLRHSSHVDFVHDLSRVWDHLKKRADGIDLYVRLGTLSSVKSDAKTLFRESLEESGGWRLVYTKRAKTANEGKRQADQMKRRSSAQDEYDFHAVAL